jgi:hypothetical protein
MMLSSENLTFATRPQTAASTSNDEKCIASQTFVFRQSPFRVRVITWFVDDDGVARRAHMCLARSCRCQRRAREAIDSSFANATADTKALTEAGQASVAHTAAADDGLMF